MIPREQVLTAVIRHRYSQAFSSTPRKGPELTDGIVNSESLMLPLLSAAAAARCDSRLATARAGRCAGVPVGGLSLSGRAAGPPLFEFDGIWFGVPFIPSPPPGSAEGMEGWEVNLDLEKHATDETPTGRGNERE